MIFQLAKSININGTDYELSTDYEDLYLVSDSGTLKLDYGYLDLRQEAIVMFKRETKGYAPDDYDEDAVHEYVKNNAEEFARYHFKKFSHLIEE